MSYDEIIGRLFIGSADAVFSIIQFSLIVNCTKDISFPKYETECIRVSVDDSADNAYEFLECLKNTNVLERIHKVLTNNQRVLVHGYINRSCIVMACYLIKYHCMSDKDALIYIKNKHNVAFYGDNNHIVTLFIKN